MTPTDQMYMKGDQSYFVGSGQLWLKPFLFLVEPDFSVGLFLLQLSFRWPNLRLSMTK